MSEKRSWACDHCSNQVFDHVIHPGFEAMVFSLVRNRFSDVSPRSNIEFGGFSQEFFVVIKVIHGRGG